MYLPSKSLLEILTSEQTGVFCESNSLGERSIVAKLPTSVIKSMLLGAKVEFYVFVKSLPPHNIALGLKVFDNKESPFHALLAQRWNNSNNIFDQSFLDSDLNLALFDETDASVVYGKIKIKTNFKNKRIFSILKNFDLSSSNNHQNNIKFMDSVCASLGSDDIQHPGFKVLTFHFPVSIEELKTIYTHHVNDQGSSSYEVDAEIDGARQERQIYQALCLMGNSSTTLSPLVTIGKKERELTDVLTCSLNRQVIAIESKCLQVDLLTLEKSRERASSNMIKHCRKAIGQLEGVYKAIARGERVYDGKGKTLLHGDKYDFYGIVLIDEYRESKDWSEIIKLLSETSTRHNICINVITISEMIYNMKLSSSNTDTFIRMLYERHKCCINERNINIKFINSALPTMLD
ncbi:hypothetical protein [Pantoea ananatis]|uniref:hypothetical protein n=1 Tax=Pantoea ananas TaxID=553 RepID=UPI0023B1E09D|nr:hypothetical protein [Pantoea ananatis]